MDTCTATCAAGSYAAANVCTTCTPVANAATGATYTCTSASDSRVSACASDAFKTAGVAGASEPDLCTTCTTVANKATTGTLGVDGAITCTSATTSRVANCALGYFKDGTGTKDVCTICGTTTTNAATYTCTTGTDEIAAKCMTGYWLVSVYLSDLYLFLQPIM
jgi:hypothetical protein